MQMWHFVFKRGGPRHLHWQTVLLCCSALAVLCWQCLQPPASEYRRPLLQDTLPAAGARMLTHDELRADVAYHLPSLPLDYWHHNKQNTKKIFKKNCAPLPSVYELEFNNMYWQTMRTNQSTFHIYGAYLDTRNTSRIGPAIRLLAVHDRVKSKQKTHCQIWFEESEAPVLVRTLEYTNLWDSKRGNYRDDGAWQPYLLACVLPTAWRDVVPAAVSLVAGPCDRASNLLRVHYDAPPPEDQHEFAICVKGLDFQHNDVSLRLVEWIELIRLLGAHRVHFYKLQIHPNMARVLEHYKHLGHVTITSVSLPGGQPNQPALRHMYLKKKITQKRQMELVPYNDCLYRNMYRYRWLVLLDIDEVIVPLKDMDWSGLMKRVLSLSTPITIKPPRSSYHATNLYYLDALKAVPEPDAPPYMHMLQHVWRTRNFTKPGAYVKSFHDTKRVLALHNHAPLVCLGAPCSSFPLPKELARLQHYREDCVAELSKSCAEMSAEPVRDAALWRWRDQLVPRVEATLRKLGLIPPTDMH